MSKIDDIVSQIVIEQAAEQKVIDACSDVLDVSVCSGFVYKLGDIVIQNLLALVVTPDYMCAEVLH